MKSTAHGLAASTRVALLAGVAFAGMGLPGVALAQDEAADEEFGNEIVVTATKREQTLQDVPVAVSVTSAETLERAQIRDIKDLTSVVPSLRVGQLQSSANTNFFIRGFGNGANNAGIEPSVGVFIDGVYRSRSAAQIGDFPDVQRIEVLRGPQSTLFGKNASAGVISIVTQKPSFTFGGNVEVSYGNYDAKVLKGMVTGPLSETVAVSLAGGINKRDGYNRDLGTGDRTNERDRWFLRGQMLFEPSNQLSLRLIGDYGKIDENCCGVVNVLASQSTGILRLLGGNVNPANKRFGNVVYGNVNSTNDIENWGLSLQADWKTGPVTITSITAIRKTSALTNQDSDFTSADLIGGNAQDLRIRTFTQELRAATDFDGPLNLLAGAFWFDESIEQTNQIFWGNAARPYANTLVAGLSGCALSLYPSACPTPGGPTPVPLENTFGQLDALAAGNPALATRYVGQFFKSGTGLNESYGLNNKALSLFAQADFEITDRLTLTGGISYTKDRKNYRLSVESNDVFANVNFNAPQYAPFRQQLLYLGGLASQVGSALNLGRNATSAEITAFAGANPTAFNAINTAVLAFANANQNNPAANPLNALRPLQFLPPFLGVPNAVEPGRTRDSKVTYTARLAYDVNDDINVYLSYATGYKASSINLSRDSRPSFADQAAITARGIGVVNQTYGSRFAAPETSTVYEAGIKANFGMASANIAVFEQSIKGFQSNIFTGTGFFLANAGKQTTRGVEFEGTVKPVGGLVLTGALTYLDPEYKSFPLSACGNATGQRPAGIPKWSGTVGGEYTHELGNGDKVIGRASYHWESSVQIAECLPAFVVKNPNTGAIVNAAPGIAAAQAFRRTVKELDASLTYAMEMGLELSVWGRNLTNNRYLINIFDSPAQSGSVSGYPNQPRTYGGSVRYRF